MDDFVRCASLLASPATEPAVRAQADAWLAAFRRDAAAWGVALELLQLGAAAVPPEVRLQAAALLAWKCKRQLAQLQPVARQAELAEALAALAAGGPQHDVALRGLCAALANLAIQCSSWAAPLEALGPRLGQGRMLDFLTILPQECEDAVAAAQSASAELAWGLKARAHEWSPGVAAWLYSVHAAGSPTAHGSPGPPPSPSQAAAATAAAAGDARWQKLTCAVLCCFTAWVKWGCLQHIEHSHAAYFASLAGELLFARDAAASLPFHPACLPVAVDAASEVVEHATEALQPLLLQLAAALPARAAALRAAGCEEEAGEVAHVFALFCSTHCMLCAAKGLQGDVLRQGLLQLLALPLEPGSDSGGAVLPVVGALCDVLEHLLAQQRGERSADEEQEEVGGLPCSPLAPPARRSFAAHALEVLLAQLQPYPSAFQLDGGEAAAAAAADAGLDGMHSPLGVPDVLRREAAPVVDCVGELLGADAMVQRLVTHAEAATRQHGPGSAAAQAALDVCLHVLGGTSSLLEAACSERAADDPLPQWLPGVLRLWSLVPEVDGSRGAAGGADLAPLTILHADLLGSFSQLGGLVMPLLQGLQPEHQQALMQLVLVQAVRALSSRRRTVDIAAGSTEDAVERAAAALRVLCSSAAAAGLPISPDLLSGLKQAMLLLQQPASGAQQGGPARASTLRRYQDAFSQLVTALVHALQGVPPGDGQLRMQAEAAVQQHVLQPLAAALAEVQGLVAVGPTAQPAQLRATVWRLQVALQQYQALLNGLESYAPWYDDPSSSASSGHNGSMLAGPGAAAVQEGVAAAAVAAFLGCWPQLAHVCEWVGRLPAAGPGGGGLAAARRDCYQELAQCQASCISLDAEGAQRALPSFADTAAACFFLPGATVLSRPLIQALEAYGATEHLQQPLLSTVATILGAPPAQRLAALRGGDGDPETTQALLSLLGCCLRQAAQWRAVAPPAAGAVEAVLRLGLPLAAANAACNHRDTALQAVSTLVALLALLLAADSPLHGALLGFAAQQGPTIAQGLLLALLSLCSGSHLPKVVSLMSDLALLAASLAIAQLQQAQPAPPPPPPLDAVVATAGGLLGSWVAAARTAVVRAGLLSEESMAALLAQWDWQPVLQQAALQLAPQGGCGGAGAGAASVAEVRRAMQRSVRQLADLVRREGIRG